MRILLKNSVQVSPTLKPGERAVDRLLVGIRAVLGEWRSSVGRAYHFWARPSLGRAAAVAALLASLVLLAPAIPWRRRAGWFAIAATTMTAVIASWAIHNTATFEERVCSRTRLVKWVGLGESPPESEQRS